MTQQPRWQWMALWSTVTLCALLALAAHIRIRVPLTDDAFITYRYSANLIMGRGLVYNPGERVFGATSPGYALLLGGIGALTGWRSLPTVSRVVNFIAQMVAAGALSRIAWRGTRKLLLSAATFAITTLGPETLLSSVSGMESPVFVMLTALVMLLCFERRWTLAAVLCGLAPLFGPEGVFVVGLMGITLLMHRSELGARSIAGAAALMLIPSLAWALFSQAYFGSVVPHSIIAKQHGLYPVGINGSAILVADYVTHSLALISVFQLPARTLSVGVGGFGLAILLVGIILISGGTKLIHRFSLIGAFGVLPFVLIIFYAISSTLVLPHYYGLFEVLLKAAWWAGLYAIGIWISERLHLGCRIVGAVSALIVLLPCLWLYPWRSVISGQVNTVEIDPAVLRQNAYYQLAETLGPRLPEGTTILMSEIGALGFYLPNVRVLDSAGLVSHEAVAYHPVDASLRVGRDIGVVPPQFVRDQLPDMIITLEVFARYGVIDEAWFKGRYTPVIVIQGYWLPWGSKALYIFSRNDFEPGMQLQG